MTLAVSLSPEQLAELADQIARRIQPPSSTPSTQKLAYTIPEAVELSGCTTWDIRTAIRRGELPAKQAGQRGKYTIHHAALDAWLRGLPTTHIAHHGRGQRSSR